MKDLIALTKQAQPLRKPRDFTMLTDNPPYFILKGRDFTRFSAGCSDLDSTCDMVDLSTTAMKAFS